MDPALGIPATKTINLCPFHKVRGRRFAALLNGFADIPSRPNTLIVHCAFSQLGLSGLYRPHRALRNSGLTKDIHKPKTSLPYFALLFDKIKRGGSRPPLLTIKSLQQLRRYDGYDDVQQSPPDPDQPASCHRSKPQAQQQ